MFWSFDLEKKPDAIKNLIRRNLSPDNLKTYLVFCASFCVNQVQVYKVLTKVCYNVNTGASVPL